MIVVLVSVGTLAACKDDDGTSGDGQSGSDSGGDTATTGGETTGGTETGEGTTTGDTGSPTGDGTGSTGPGAVCGDGVQEGGELCDDGNDVNDDGCSNDCVPSGEEVWTTLHDGVTFTDDWLNGVAVDGEGNVVVAGVESNIADPDLFVAKYTPDGEEIWTVVEDGGETGDDSARGIAVDSQGNIAVAGRVYPVAGNSADVWVAMYDPDGTEIWSDTHNGPVSTRDEGWGVAVDSNDEVFVVGFEFTAGEGRNAWIRKYDASGTELWTLTYDGPMSGPNEATGVAVDANDDIVVVGYEEVDQEGNNAWIAHYAGDGSGSTWMTSIDGGTAGADFAEDVALDPDGNIVVVGEIQVAEDALQNPIYDAWLAKLDPSDGAEIWSVSVNGPIDESDFGSGVAVDPSGNVIMSASVAVAQGVTPVFYQGWTIKHDADGVEVWTNIIGPEDDEDLYTSDVATDSISNVFTVGQITGDGTLDGFIRKIAP